MSDTFAVVDRVRGAVARGASVRDAIATEVRRANEESLSGRSPHNLDERAVAVAVDGFGALQPLLDDHTVEEIWVNDDTSVFVARSGIHEQLPVVIPPDDLRSIVERMLRRTGRRIDYSQPFVDASLPDGSRLHVVIPPITRANWSVNIRKFSRTVRTLDALVAAKTIPLSLIHI
jgi:pilus assembly protein CpaF